MRQLKATIRNHDSKEMSNPSQETQNSKWVIPAFIKNFYDMENKPQYITNLIHLLHKLIQNS